jgi:hypothetical protein
MNPENTLSHHSPGEGRNSKPPLVLVKLHKVLDRHPRISGRS